MSTRALITPRPSPPPDAERRRRVGWLGMAALVAGLALIVHGPIAQWADYHQFADTRAWLGIGNAWNVLSNLPFAAIGAWGLWRLAREHDASNGPWWMFCAALLVTSFTSSLYHLAPANDTLIGDRLAIAWACAALACAFVGERLSPRWATWGALAVAFTVASMSVAWWWVTDRHGVGDLRAYLFVQFVPMIIVPLGLLWRIAPLRSSGFAPDAAWWAVLALYAVAKALELADGWWWAATDGLVSGHPLKHLVAAGAAACCCGRASRAAARPISSGSRR